MALQSMGRHLRLLSRHMPIMPDQIHSTNEIDLRQILNARETRYRRLNSDSLHFTPNAI